MKTIGKWNIFLLLVFLGLLGLNAVIGTDYSRRNVEFLPEMTHSVPFDAQMENPVFADGKTQQSPIAGTIARGEMPLHFGPEPKEALRAGEELTNSVERAPNTLARGTLLYNRFCLPCHGSAGLGDGPIALRGYPPPTSLAASKATTMKDGQILHIITYGQANMPSYAGQIDVEDRWAIVHHIRSLQKETTPASTNNTGALR